VGCECVEQRELFWAQAQANDRLFYHSKTTCSTALYSQQRRFHWLATRQAQVLSHAAAVSSLPAASRGTPHQVVILLAGRRQDANGDGDLTVGAPVGESSFFGAEEWVRGCDRWIARHTPYGFLGGHSIKSQRA
jgi:hypothetical protein